MNKKVEKILEEYEPVIEAHYGNWETTPAWEVAKKRKELAKQICQLSEEEELKLRTLLWASHACSGKYADDGELQCNRFLPTIDFKRDSPEEIERKIILHYQQLGYEPKLESSRKVCSGCPDRFENCTTKVECQARVERILKWLKQHNDFNECGIERMGCGLLLTIKDYQALKEEGVK